MLASGLHDKDSNAQIAQCWIYWERRPKAGVCLMKICFIVISILATISPRVVLGADASALWNANSETDIAGYEFHYGVETGVYDGDFINATVSPLDVPLASLADENNPRLDLTGIPSCVPVVFVLKAYDLNGNRSAYSDEMEATLPHKPSNVAVVENSPNHITISWTGLPLDDVGSIDSYFVHYGDTAGGPYNGTGATQGNSPIEVFLAGSNPSFDVDSLPLGSPTYFVIEAVCDLDGSLINSRHSDEVVYGGCTPSTCNAEGANCGQISDGCSGTLDCGTCTLPETCGGGGTANACGEGSCAPTSCEPENANCGVCTVAGGCGCRADSPANSNWAVFALVCFALRRRRFPYRG